MAADAGEARDAYEGFGQDVGIGSKPALIVVDFQNGFVDPRYFGGGNIKEAAQATVPLLAAARQGGRPVAFSRAVYPEACLQGNAFVAKVPSLRLLSPEASITQIVPELAPLPGELVVDKQAPSPFFGTNLSAWLRGLDVDSLVLVGCTTSGCLRAAVVDALSHNFRCVVVRECAGDRAQEPHDASIFDMRMKYCDIVTRDKAVGMLAPEGTGHNPSAEGEGKRKREGYPP